MSSPEHEATFHQSGIWSRLPNEPAARRSPSQSPIRDQSGAFDRSPRSSISSGVEGGNSSSVTSTSSPSYPNPVALPLFLQSHLLHHPHHSKLIESSTLPPSSLSGSDPYTTSPPPASFSLSRRPVHDLPKVVPSSTLTSVSPPSYFDTFDVSTHSTSSASTISVSTLKPSQASVPHHHTAPIPTAALLSPPIGFEPESEHTQEALAEIFGGQVRPHYQKALIPAQTGSSPPSANRSYFSSRPAGPTPQANHPRSRSISSAAALDFASFSSHHHESKDSLGGMNTQFGSLNQRSDEAYGYRPSNQDSSHFSSSLPSGANPIRIGAGSPSTAGYDDQASSPPSARPRLVGAFGSFSGALGGGNEYRHSGWRSSSETRAASFGWEAGSEDQREGRSRDRSDGHDSLWSGEPTSGIGLSNMSPFTRDGGRALMDAPDSNGYKARRDYSLGAVGSGRKRGEAAWGAGRGERTLNEAENEDEDSSSFAPPTKSGATSRRHSFAAFNPPSRSQIGFHLPEEDRSRSNAQQINGGFGSNALSGNGTYGAGSSAINDDDLAADLNSLHLNLEAHAAATNQRENGASALGLVGSMPVNFPPARSSLHQFGDAESSRSPPLRSPALSASTIDNGGPTNGNGGSSSGFFQPQASAPTTSLSPSTAQRASSRFEFSGTSPSKQNMNLAPMTSSGPGNTFAFGGQQQQQQQQQRPQGFMPNFGGLPPQVSLPPPGNTSNAFTPGLMSQQGPLPPSFGNFLPMGSAGLGGQLHPQQQQGFLPPPPPQPNTFFNGPTGPLSGNGGMLSRPQQQQQQHQQLRPPQAQPSMAGLQPSSNGPAPQDLNNLGRGIPLHTVPANAPLYIVEFKAGRKDLFFVDDPNLQLRQGDLVIVEADRGKDIGKFFKPCSLDEVQAFQQRLVEMALGQLAQNGGGSNGVGGGAGAGGLARMTKEFAPKRLYGKASSQDTQLLLSKAQDEIKALALVRSKVAQKNLPMEVCDAEWQWDRRKLTFYYTADTRVDFRELVRELFRVYKTRVWMCCLDATSSEAWNFSK